MVGRNVSFFAEGEGPFTTHRREGGEMTLYVDFNTEGYPFEAMRGQEIYLHVEDAADRVLVDGRREAELRIHRGYSCTTIDGDADFRE